MAPPTCVTRTRDAKRLLRMAASLQHRIGAPLREQGRRRSHGRAEQLYVRIVVVVSVATAPEYEPAATTSMEWAPRRSIKIGKVPKKQQHVPRATR